MLAVRVGVPKFSSSAPIHKGQGPHCNPHPGEVEKDGLLKLLNQSAGDPNPTERSHLKTKQKKQIRQLKARWPELEVNLWLTHVHTHTPHPYPHPPPPTPLPHTHTHTCRYTCNPSNTKIMKEGNIVSMAFLATFVFQEATLLLFFKRKIIHIIKMLLNMIKIISRGSRWGASEDKKTQCGILQV